MDQSNGSLPLTADEVRRIFIETAAAMNKMAAAENRSRFTGYVLTLCAVVGVCLIAIALLVGLNLQLNSLVKSGAQEEIKREVRVDALEKDHAALKHEFEGFDEYVRDMREDMSAHGILNKLQGRFQHAPTH